VSSEENKLKEGDAEHDSPTENQEYLDKPPEISSTAGEISFRKSLEEESTESENDITTSLQAFRKVGSFRKSLEESNESENDINTSSQAFRKVGCASDEDPSSDVGSGQELQVQPGDSDSEEWAEELSDDPRSSFMLRYNKLVDSKSLENDGSFRTTKVNTSSNVPNPFLDDSFDEEIGFPPNTLPLSIENANDDGNARDEDLNDTPILVEGGKCWKSKLCWIALFVMLGVVAIVVAIVVAQSKQKSSEPSNPSVKPPSETASPTRLPTTPPTVTIIPNWAQVGGDLVGESPGDEAGFSVSVSEDGSRAIIGARRSAKDGMKNRGAARVFQFDTKTGFFVPIFDMYGEAAGDQCGFSVSMSKNGKRIAVGSLGSDKGGQNSGQVRIFDENELSSTWVLVSELIGKEETSLFGASISLSQDGSNLAVGAPYHSEGTDMARSGRSYVYREAKESEWEQVGGPMYGTSSNDLFGWSVSFSPNAQFVAVGAPRLEGSLDSGYAKVFSFEENAWNVYGEVMSIGVPGDRFGFSVSLAGDNTLQRVAIGAPGMSENGEGSGLASVYENDGNGWQRSGDDLLGDSWGENLGYAVSLTPDATRMVVGVPNKKLDGVPVGQVQVLDVNSGNIVSAGDMYGRDGEKFGVSVSVSYEGKLVYGGASMANLVRVYGDIYQR